MASPRQTLRTTGVAIRLLLISTLVLGVGYSAVILGVGQLAFPAAANGSTITRDGEVVGSALIGQSFTDADGVPLPEYFQSRPSAAGDGYDAGASSGSNLGPENADLVALIEDRRANVSELEGVDPSAVPVDALTASASGLDPHISPEYAMLQVPRVARERGLTETEVGDLVESMIQGRDLGYLGEPTVNVLRLNLALDERSR
ncbi:potassium-transporting ATPase subunit KdpC [Agromyces atrinae]|uniref:potassium-transporting ATPase subunit KdpC n=1 Tax=Agromyces atrinae TaxID=592376 RepID=UPI001F5933FE|nr:potassium-transporting ATPase subunit KdpC [Agromyces atrinae]MCI2957264.1 potassium-transporting ATPase subunit KdpC [Agromyces atrinae]